MTKKNSLRRSVCLFLVWSLPALTASTQSSPLIPTVYQDLYSSLNISLTLFNTTLNTRWNGSKYPVLLTGTLTDADANAGPQLANPGVLTGVLLELQALKAMGVQAVTVEVGFPMLYEPFFASQSQYQQFVNFYAQVASSIKALGLKLVVENEFLLSDATSDWNIAPFYATLNWQQYQQARAQTAQVVVQTMHPDYLVVLEEPDTEAKMTGQSQANTVSGATGMLSLILAGLQTSRTSGLKVGAGVGTWHPQYLQFTQSFVAMPLDFIDMHIFPVNHAFLTNSLAIVSAAAAAGKPVTISQTWLDKVRDTELGVLTPDQTRARDPFSFWAPLDTYFVQTLVNLAYYAHMTFLNPFNSQYFNAYLPYDSATQNLTPGQILTQEIQQANQSIENASYTSTGLSYYKIIVSPPDKTPPSIPSNLKVVSGAPTTTYLTWNAATDNVGVAGYNLYRDGVYIGTTAQTFYQDAGLSGSTTYTYDVKAFDLANNVSALSLSVPVTTKDVTPPTIPGNVSATAVSKVEVKVTWSPSVDDTKVSYYHVFRGISAKSLSKIATTYSTPTAFTDYPVNPATTYYYGVEAEDGSGNVSAMSAVVSVTTPAN